MQKDTQLSLEVGTRKPRRSELARNVVSATVAKIRGRPRGHGTGSQRHASYIYSSFHIILKFKLKINHIFCFMNYPQEENVLCFKDIKE